ncbi:carbohydrate ABC transporter permease [Spirochaeta cellobiosiphila]|uniref:carbohydrate ABC transporter permease n=1 Tax=Spirochaeta cellobiosiphila TaxID=504483 RepID=UPI000418D338|nr:carbohydrate ABC transporter permease [Spirochaeta cellobiosiphila]
MTVKNTLLKYLRVFVVTFVSMVFVFPLIALIFASLRPGQDLMRFGISLKTLIPTQLSLDYILALFGPLGENYRSWFLNSIVITALQVVISIFLSSMVGYGLGVYRFKGRNVIMVLVIFVMMIPIQILILPLYKLSINLKIIDTYVGVILPFAVFPLGIFFFRQYVLGMPKDYIDAARIDGLNDYMIFVRIMAPIMAPAYGAMSILIALNSWNQFLWPLIVLRSSQKFTLPIGLNTLLTPYGNNYDVLISGAALATIPIIIVFIFFQKNFMTGMTAGGVKG